MQSYDIRTWSCAACGYAQDFEPTAENMSRHFNASHKKVYRIDDVRENECPSCALRGIRKRPMAKVADPAKKMKHCYWLDSERPQFEAALRSKKGVVREADGSVRQETPQEKEARVAERMAKAKFLTDAEAAEMRSKYEDK